MQKTKIRFIRFIQLEGNLVIHNNNQIVSLNKNEMYAPNNIKCFSRAVDPGCYITTNLQISFSKKISEEAKTTLNDFLKKHSVQHIAKYYQILMNDIALTESGLVILWMATDMPRFICFEFQIKKIVYLCYNILFIDMIGDVYSISYNMLYTLGSDSVINMKQITKLPFKNIKKLTCGLNSLIGIDKNGDVWIMGDVFTKMDIPNIRDVYADDIYIFFITTNNELYSVFSKNNSLSNPIKINLTNVICMYIELNTYIVLTANKSLYMFSKIGFDISKICCDSKNYNYLTKPQFIRKIDTIRI